MSIFLENTTDQGEAATASYSSAALLVSIPNNAVPAASFTARNTGTAGIWYIKFRRTSGPTSTVYSWKLGPGEHRTFPNPPKGDIYALQVGANGVLSWFVGWRQ